MLPQARSTRTQRGVALITAMFFSLLCVGLAMGFLLQVPVDLAATTDLERTTEASYIADAAIADSMAWISFELANSREPCSVADPTPLRSGNVDDWSWTCRVEPDSGTPPNGISELRLYKLTALASRDGDQQYRIVADVQAGQSFSRFSVFFDEASTLSPFYDFIVTPTAKMRGPIHKNKPISFLVASSLLGGALPSGIRPFNSTISTSSSHHDWTNSSYSAFSPTPTDYDNIFTNGEADLLYGVLPRPMPSDSTGLANAAWGGLAPFPAPPGVTISPAGGIFIEGDVDRLELTVNGSNHQVITIDQGGAVTTVIEDSATDQRVVSGPSGSSTVSGLGSGVIFATGDILGLKGTNKGPHTIANRFDFGQRIEISGSLTRSDTPVGSEPSGTDDRLGVVSATINVASESILVRDQDNPLYLYASLLATEIFEVIDRKIGAPGAMAIYGGITSGEPWRTVRVSSSNYSVQSGYGSLSRFGSADIIYDKLLANEPPPEYPSTAGSELIVRAWREQPL